MDACTACNCSFRSISTSSGSSNAKAADKRLSCNKTNDGKVRTSTLLYPLLVVDLGCFRGAEKVPAPAGVPTTASYNTAQRQNTLWRSTEGMGNTREDRTVPMRALMLVMAALSIAACNSGSRLPFGINAFDWGFGLSPMLASSSHVSVSKRHVSFALTNTSTFGAACAPSYTFNRRTSHSIGNPPANRDVAVLVVVVVAPTLWGCVNDSPVRRI